MAKIKICGLKRIEDVEYINSAKPEYAGFVFWEKSKRNVSFDFAKKMREGLDADIKTVGVFVDRPVEDIVYLTKEKIISCVQLHGNESDEVISRIRGLTDKDITIIKAFEVKDEKDVLRANASTADMVLIDSGKGSGNTFDWSILEKIDRDYFLAGGLSVENVAQAVEKLRPYAVDVSSRVETDGLKDKAKIEAFCKEVRGIKN